MPHLHYRHVDVFSDVPFGGNSLPVFYDVPDLDGDAMLRITREMRHFAAVFVQPAEKPRHAKVRVFDLFEELPFAGHPLLGAAAALQQLHTPGEDAEWKFDLRGRSVSVTVTFDGDHCRAVLDQGPPLSCTWLSNERK